MVSEAKLKTSWSAVILAGGLGTRLNPLTAHICKPMVSVTNKPMVDYAIDHLRYAGIKKIIIVVKHMGDELRAQIQSTWTEEICQELGIEILVPKVESIGTADAVRKVAHLITTENFVVSMADIVTNLPMRKFMAFHEAKQAQATVSMKRIEEMATKYGNTMLDQESRIIRFLEKPSSEEIYLSALTGGGTDFLPIINTGIYCFSQEILDLIVSTDFIDFGKHIFPFLLENQYALYGFVDDYYWMDVGNHTTYLWANWDILRQFGYPVLPEGTQQQKRNVWYQESEPPQNLTHGDYVCLGRNNRYGIGSKIVSLSTIGSNVVIDDDTEIDRSVIWDNVQIGKNVHISNSIIANDCEIADFCIIRSNTVLGPGVKITSPHTVLDNQVIAENTIIS